jgi:hypothetical protein
MSTPAVSSRALWCGVEDERAVVDLSWRWRCAKVAAQRRPNGCDARVVLPSVIKRKEVTLLCRLPPGAEPKRFFPDRFPRRARARRHDRDAIAGKADFADLISSLHLEGFALEEGIVKKAAKNIPQGAGVRVVAGDKTGRQNDDVTVDALRPCLDDRPRHADAGGTNQPVAAQPTRLAYDCRRAAAAAA